MIKSLVTLVLALSLASAAHGAPRDVSSDVSYSVAPVLKDGALMGLAVELRFVADGSGVTRLSLPDQSAARDGARSDLTGLQVTGARLESAGGVDVLSSRPGASIVVRYRLVSGYDAPPEEQPLRAIILPAWFAVHGERAFVRPQGRDAARVSVRFEALPAGWIVASDLGAGSSARVGNLDERFLIGGAGWLQTDRSLGPARLRLYYLAAAEPKHLEAGATRIAAIAQAGFRFWGDRPWDLFVPVIPTGDTGGRGIEHGFLFFAGPDTDFTSLDHDFAHEFEHAWTSRQIGGFPAADPDLEAWLNEGFTELIADRILVGSGLWSLKDWVGGLNASLLQYGASPVRDAPNRRINAERFSNYWVGKLPYDRGRLLGLVWDRRLRAATGGRVGLQDALQLQRRLALAAKARGEATSADRLFPIAVRQAAGVDLSGDIARYVDAGAPISLPPDLFGACGAFETVTQPVFDRGFDIYATIRNGRRLTGLEPGGPAERAGLREGQLIAMDEVPTNDSQQPLTYWVIGPDGSRRAVTYKPQGKASVSFQQFRLNPALTAAAAAHCRAIFSGAA